VFGWAFLTPPMPVEPLVDHGIGQLLRLATATIYSFSGAFNVPWKNGYDPSVSFDAGTDGVSDTPVLHRGIVRRNWKLSNRFYPTMIYGYSTYLNNCSRILTFQRPTIFCSWQFREDSFNRVRFKPGTFGVLFLSDPILSTFKVRVRTA
jgi:hypothetical protein